MRIVVERNYIATVKVILKSFFTYIKNPNVLVEKVKYIGK